MKKTLALSLIFGLGIFISACNFDGLFGPHDGGPCGGRHHGNDHDADDTVIVTDTTVKDTLK